MREIVRVEYRGIDDVLEVGASLIVESCEGGVLRLRNPAYKPEAPVEKPVQTSGRGARGKAK